MLASVRAVADTSVLVFAVASTLSAGLSVTFREVVAPLREVGRVLRALVANFVVVPLLAAALAYLLALPPAQATGLILLGTAAGAPFVLELIAIAAGDLSLGTTLLVLCVPTTVIAMPLLVAVLAPDVAASPGAVAPPLALTLILPLAVGLLVRQLLPRWASGSQRVVRPVSTAALVVMMFSTLALNLRELGQIVASLALVAILVLEVGAFFAGYALATPHRERRVVLGLGTAQRNIAAATVVAVEDIHAPDTLVFIVVAGMIGLLILLPIARWVRPSRPLEPPTEATHAA